MATLLRMPEVAANATHATLAAWSKKEGEPIAAGDCLAEVETDKAVYPIEASFSGTFKAWQAAVDQAAELGCDAIIAADRVIARIAKEGRKYGVSLGVITQRPGELDQTILSQCSTLFAMRLANDRDQEIIRSAIPDSSISTTSFISSTP